MSHPTPRGLRDEVRKTILVAQLTSTSPVRFDKTDRATTSITCSRSWTWSSEGKEATFTSEDLDVACTQPLAGRGATLMCHSGACPTTSSA
jgi:hypothetical protein